MLSWMKDQSNSGGTGTGIGKQHPVARFAWAPAPGQEHRCSKRERPAAAGQPLTDSDRHRTENHLATQPTAGWGARFSDAP